MSQKVDANTSKYSNVYIKQGTNENGEDCRLTQSGFRFALYYNDYDTYPAAGIGGMRGNTSIYISSGMVHLYDDNSKTANWVNTLAYNSNSYSPRAILLVSNYDYICGVQREPGIYILSAPYAVREFKAIIPDSEITVTKLG